MKLPDDGCTCGHVRFSHECYQGRCLIGGCDCTEFSEDEL